MPLADTETRQRIYSEYKDLDDEYRKLVETLRFQILTFENYPEKVKLLELGSKLDLKKLELA